MSQLHDTRIGQQFLDTVRIAQQRQADAAERQAAALERIADALDGHLDAPLDEPDEGLLP
jgi:hypothetical protein